MYIFDKIYGGFEANEPVLQEIIKCIAPRPNGVPMNPIQLHK